MGCPNCEEFLNLRGSSDAVNDCCSQVFEGVITLVDPQVSWVAKWQRLNGYVPGTYAVKVTGIVSGKIRYKVARFAADDFVIAARGYHPGR